MFYNTLFSTSVNDVKKEYDLKNDGYVKSFTLTRGARASLRTNNIKIDKTVGMNSNHTFLEL